MILLTTDEIILLHSKLISRTGGSDGVRDKNLLESALYSAVSGFDGFDVYPSIEEKSARLMYSLVNNHPFIDGNKRIGVLVMLMTLKLNDVIIKYSQNELIILGLGVADGSYGYCDILKWIKNHIEATGGQCEKFI